MGKQWKQRDFILGGSNITADGDCRHEIRRHLPLGGKAMTNLDRLLISRDVTNKGSHSQSYDFPSSHVSVQFSSVAQFCLTLCDPMGCQHASPACPSPAPTVYSNSCPFSQWCHPTISSSVIPFSSCLQSFPASGSFPMSQFFASGGQSIGVSASASVLPMNIQDWFPLGWTGWISLQSKGLSSLLQRHSSKASVLRCSAFFTVQLSHPHVTTGKTFVFV